jgi:putative spermidine/putrescine transport system substrate-binding protein
MQNFDSWVIVKGSPNKDIAMKFLAFAVKPEIMAEFPKFYPYGPANKKSYEKLTPETLARLPTAPAHYAKAVITDDNFWLQNLDSLSQRFNAWVVQ